MFSSFDLSEIFKDKELKFYNELFVKMCGAAFA